MTAVHAPGTEIATLAGAVEEYRPRIVMKPDEAKALDEQLRECMRAILREGVDFGTIPGAGDKNNLLKPGAEKLLQWFGFGHETAEVKVERDDPDSPSGIADKVRRIGVTYRTEVTKTLPGGGKVVVSTCEGYAGYDEDRYFTTAEEARTKAESRERANAARYQRDVNPAKWQFAAEYRAPWNTLIKMAQKRSLVGAAILATSASGLFTQDMEDMGPQAAPEPPGPKFGDVAMKFFKGLNQHVLEEVGRWYRGKGWPDPRNWDAEQWCMALQAAGFIAGQQHAAVSAAAAEAAELARPEPLEDGDPWADKIADLASQAECDAAEAEIFGLVKHRQMAEDHGDLITAHIRHKAAALAGQQAAA